MRGEVNRVGVEDGEDGQGGEGEGKEVAVHASSPSGEVARSDGRAGAAFGDVE